MLSGNMNGTNLNTYYSSVISLRFMRTIVLLGKLKNIETITGDISNGYLTAHTTEKIVFNAGPEFEPFGHAGYLLIINSDLYALNIPSARLHSRLSDDRTALIFVPSMGGYNIWMSNEGDY